MKFFKVILISSFLSLNWTFPCDVQDTPEPFHLLYSQCSIRHNQLPRNDVPNTSYPTLEIPVEEVEKNDLSISLLGHLYLGMAGIQYAYAHDLYSLLLLIYERFPNHISELVNPDTESANHLSKRDNDTSLPTLYDNLNYLLNVNSFGILPFNKARIFIETKVTAMKLQGFNL